MCKRSTVCIAVFLVGCCLTPAIAQTSTPSLQPVALLGQTAPGTKGLEFVHLGFPAINNSGTIVFRADLTPTPQTNGGVQGALIPNGVFMASNKVLTRLVGYGDTVPNEQVLFTNFGDPAINDAGQVAFLARMGSGFENQGIFLQKGGSLNKVARTGDSVPGVDGKFGVFGGVSLNNSGTIAFAATITGGISSAGLFVSESGRIRSLVLTGVPVPQGQNEVIDHFGAMSMNEGGQIAFAASAHAPDGATRSGIFVVTSGGTIKTVALEGGMVGTRTLRNLSEPSINDAGDVAFMESYITNSRFKTPYTSGVHVALAGAGITPISTADNPVNAGDPVVHGGFQSPRIIRRADGTNSTLFFAGSVASGEAALWHSAQNTLTPLLREGDAAPTGGTYHLAAALVAKSSGYFAFVSNLKGASTGAAIFVGKMSF